MADKILVLAVDRDDDIGRKTGRKGPIIGEEENVETAKELALADPEDSDANTIFAAVKTARELQEEGKIVEIATVTGHSALGFLADKNIHEQLKEVFNRFPADGVVLVTDGAEDDQVIPIILSFAPIISKKTIIVRQAAQIERTWYIIKNALKDKDLAPIFLGIPGIAILLWAIFGDLGAKLIFGVIGAYLLLMATGLDETLYNFVKTLVRGISFRGWGAPFYLASIALLFVAGYSAYQNIIALQGENAIYEAVRSAVGFSSISAVFYLIGRMLDAHLEKKAFLIGKYIKYSAIVVIFWILTDVTARILEHAANITDLYFMAGVSILFYIIISRVGDLFEESIKTSNKILGATVITRKGSRMGKITKVDEERGVVRIQMGRKVIEVPIAKIHVDSKGIVVSL